MRNWIGQTFRVGDVVGRGARQGNSSSFKLGVVQLIDDKGIKVHWRYEDGMLWFGHGQERISVPRPLENSTGRPSPDSLFLLKGYDLDRANRFRILVDEFQDRKNTGYPMSREEFVDLMQYF